jgi:hypothetical protein
VPVGATARVDLPVYSSPAPALSEGGVPVTGAAPSRGLLHVGAVDASTDPMDGTGPRMTLVLGSGSYNLVLA